MAKESAADMTMADEVMSYFDNPVVPFAPSQIDWAMGLRKGLAHDIIVRRWAREKERATERRATRK